MARTTADMVKAVLLRDYHTIAAPSLTTFITSAGLLTDRVEACATAKGKTLTTQELIEIETWLAAWFYKGPDPSYASKSTAGASGSFQGQGSFYLEDNRFGQRAKILDASGCLASIVPGPDSMRKVATGRWLGKRKSLQTNYRDRR